MFSQIERDDAYRQALCAQLRERYGLSEVCLTPAPRGWYGETWRVNSAQGSYFAKLISYPAKAAQFTRSLPVVRWMNDQGIDYISKPLEMRGGALSFVFQGAWAALFVFEEGEHTEEYPLEWLFTRLAGIYRLPIQDVEAEREVYTGDMAERVATLARRIPGCGVPGAQRVLNLLRREKDALTHCAARLEQTARQCRQQPGDFHITSGDTGGNVILNGEKITIIDWDHIRLAPVERDLWYYMWSQEQNRLIDNTLAACGLPDRLAPHRLAYYAYRGHFYHLHEYLASFLLPNGQGEAIVPQLEDYLSPQCWMERVLRAAERC
ncbi:MAG: aminoglycoside phosphotransferase family protein [Eubacteriales bacterium]|nr:aminoglycoside phosphotransferase family protein [Eubacteriales bacterium]